MSLNVRRNVGTRLGARILLLLASLASASSAEAQTGVDRLSPSSSVSVLTILPGDEIYSLFGHTAIRVRDPERGLDLTYNYGTFEFGDPIAFVGRFAYGDLEYQLADGEFRPMMTFYREVARRPVIEQLLNLSLSQRQRVFEFLEWNVRPENRAYQYDFLFDNCATRVRDVFEERVDSLQFTSESVPDATFRHLLDPYAAHRPFLDFGWDLLLGESVDRLANTHETMFLPLYLMAALDSARIQKGAEMEPFVTSKDTLFWIEGRGLPQPSPPWPSILMWGLFWLGISVTIMQRNGSWSTAGCWVDAILYGFVGVAGTVMLLMWLATLHHVTDNNWNLLWAWPTHFVAGWILSRRSRPGWLRIYLLATVILSAVTLLGWLLWPQELPAAVLPVVLLLALRSAWHVFGKGVLQGWTAPAAAS